MLVRLLRSFVLSTLSFLGLTAPVWLGISSFPQDPWIIGGLILLAFWLLNEFYTPATPKKGEIREKGSLFLMAFSQPGTLVVVFLDYFFFHTTLEIPAFLKGIGLGLSILGFCIRLLAMRTLGQQYTMFVTIREGHRLVAHGIYKYVRHPGYLGQFVFLLGFVMLMGSVWGFLMYLFWVATQIYRMYVEERVLVEHLGDQYKNYQKKTKRLIPWIF